jgi:hypothetical protein
LRTWQSIRNTPEENLGITVSQVIKEGGGGIGNDLELLLIERKTLSGVPCSGRILRVAITNTASRWKRPTVN